MRTLRRNLGNLEPTVGFEPTTPSLPWKCSTPELRRHSMKTLSVFTLERKTRFEPATLSLEG